MKKRWFLAAASLLAVLAPGVAKAQENGSSDWAGPYVGVNLGYGQSDASLTDLDDYNLIGEKIDASDEGAVGGAQLGYDFRFGQFVLGGVVEGATGDISGQGTSGASSDTHDTVDFNSLIAARVRAGYIIGDAFMIYASAGFGLVDLDVTVYDRSPAPGSNLLEGASSDQENATILGLGAEYRFNERWTIGVDWQRVDVDDMTLTADCSNCVLPRPPTFDFDVDAEFDLVRATLNWSFYPPRI